MSKIIAYGFGVEHPWWQSWWQGEGKRLWQLCLHDADKVTRNKAGSCVWAVASAQRVAMANTVEDINNVGLEQNKSPDSSL